MSTIDFFIQASLTIGALSAAITTGFLFGALIAKFILIPILDRLFPKPKT